MNKLFFFILPGFLLRSSLPLLASNPTEQPDAPDFQHVHSLSATATTIRPLGPLTLPYIKNEPSQKGYWLAEHVVSLEDGTQRVEQLWIRVDRRAFSTEYEDV